jgi:hypothetical protein
MWSNSPGRAEYSYAAWKGTFLLFLLLSAAKYIAEQL